MVIDADNHVDVIRNLYNIADTEWAEDFDRGFWRDSARILEEQNATTVREHAPVTPEEFAQRIGESRFAGRGARNVCPSFSPKVRSGTCKSKRSLALMQRGFSVINQEFYDIVFDIDDTIIYSPFEPKIEKLLETNPDDCVTIFLPDPYNKVISSVKVPYLEEMITALLLEKKYRISFCSSGVEVRNRILLQSLCTKLSKVDPSYRLAYYYHQENSVRMRSQNHEEVVGQTTFDLELVNNKKDIAEKWDALCLLGVPMDQYFPVSKILLGK